MILKNTQKSRFRSLPNPSSTELSRHPLGYLGEIAVLKKLEIPKHHPSVQRRGSPRRADRVPGPGVRPRRGLAHLYRQRPPRHRR